MTSDPLELARSELKAKGLGHSDRDIALLAIGLCAELQAEIESLRRGDCPGFMRRGSVLTRKAPR